MNISIEDAHLHTDKHAVLHTKNPPQLYLTVLFSLAAKSSFVCRLQGTATYQSYNGIKIKAQHTVPVPTYFLEILREFLSIMMLATVLRTQSILTGIRILLTGRLNF